MGSTARSAWHDTPTTAASRLGTRFLIYPQPSFIPGYERPETVWVSTPPERIGPGPSDPRMYVVAPALDKAPYEYPYLPPYRGALLAPAAAGPDGHFDRLEPGTPEFAAAHAYACVRRMLDICESYVGREIPWFFASHYRRLEIIPRLGWDNAQSGFGFLELGEDGSVDPAEPFALNFDAVAHEVGHLIVFGVMGTPVGDPPHEYLGFHEAAADFLSLIGLLHFDTAVERLLRRTAGNLLMANELDRFAELTDERQVRLVSSSLKMSDVSNEVHDLSKPMAGAMFDILVEMFQVLLFERGLSDLDPRDYTDLRREVSPEALEALARAAPLADPTRLFAVKSALEEARDLVGEMILGSWEFVDPDSLDYAVVADAMVEAAAAGRRPDLADIVADCCAWREIG